MEKISYKELVNAFVIHNRENSIVRGNSSDTNPITGVVVITEDSFSEQYSLESRSYVVSSNNKAFIDGMAGYSIFSNSLDGSDTGVRLESYLACEQGGKDGWKVDYCYLIEKE